MLDHRRTDFKTPCFVSRLTEWPLPDLQCPFPQHQWAEGGDRRVQGQNFWTNRRAVALMLPAILPPPRPLIRLRAPPRYMASSA